MYNTVTEMHIAIDNGLQQLNSNRQQSIAPEVKDMALNYAVLQFIETRTNPKTNIKQEGLEETTKRYDDVRDLKRTYITKAYKYSKDKVASILPSDYYKYIEFGCDVAYSKYNTFNTETKNLDYFVLPFKTTKQGNKYYEDFIIKGDRDILFESRKSNLPTIYSSDAKFMVINIVLEELNKIEGIDVYWEYYNTEYYKQSFVIVNSSNNIIHQEYSISYDRNQYKGEHKSKTLETYKDISNTTERPIDLYSSDISFSQNSNHYYNANRQRNPSGELIDNEIIVKEGDNFIIDNVKLIYYKKPRLINYRHEQMCEIEINREIIDLAISKLKAYIKDEGYQLDKSEQQIIE